jgi:predicted nuclease of restriction endonuclease-like (RecB) superfamily
MKPAELALYRDLLGDIRHRVRGAQQRAALSVNAEMLLMYWDIGRLIATRQAQEGWGAGVIPRLAADLKNELPEQKGFSETNLKRMVQFSQAYPDLFAIGAQPVPQLQAVAMTTGDASIGAQTVPYSSAGAPPALSWQSAIVRLSWGHNILLMQKLKDLPTRQWYAQQALEQGWSRDTLTQQIRHEAHRRQGGAITNFAQTLPDAHAALAQGLLKDPYLFDFLTLDEPFLERELETGLLRHLEKFLLELGRGFAFVGRQYRLEVSDREFFLDLLFYHLQLRCFIVVELKTGDFKPEYAGKMNFYCSAVDDLLRHPQDTATIGLILCQTKDRVLAEYSLRDIHKPIGLADYELTRALPTELASSLPSIEDIEAELADEIDGEGAR